MRTPSKRYANSFILFFTITVWVYISIIVPNKNKKRVLFIPKQNHKIQKEIFRELGYSETADAYSADFIYISDKSKINMVNDVKTNCIINYLPGTELLTNRKSLYEEFLNIENDSNANIPANLGNFIPETFYLPRDKNSLLYSLNNLPNDTIFIAKDVSSHKIKHVFNKQSFKENILTNKSIYIQSLVDPPLLLNGKKLSASIYVLLQTRKSSENGQIPKQLLEFIPYPKNWQIYLSKEKYDKKQFLKSLKTSEKSYLDFLKSSKTTNLSKSEIYDKVPAFDEVESLVDTIIEAVLNSINSQKSDLNYKYYEILKFNFEFSDFGRPNLISIDTADLEGGDGNDSLYTDIFAWALHELDV